LIGFVYGAIDPSTDRDIDTLLEVLALSDYWQIADLHRAVQAKIGALISLKTHIKSKTASFLQISLLTSQS
jgi:hypothetical protein